MLKTLAVMRLYLLASVLFFCVGTLLADEVVITAEVVPTHILPGLPVTFDCILTNPSPVSVALETSVTMVVTPSGGETFETTSTAQLDQRVSQSATELLLQPGETRDVVFQANEAAGSPGVFADSRTVRPGDYSIRLRFFRKEADEDPTRPLVTFLSNPMNLTVDEPQGDDMLVWRRMQALAAPGEWNSESWMLKSELWPEIERHYRTSHYFQQIAWLLNSNDSATIDEIQFALSQGPSAVQSDRLRLSLSKAHYNLAVKAISSGNLSLALQEAATARQIASDVATNGSARYLRKFAGESVDYIGSDAEVRALYDRTGHTSAPAPAYLSFLPVDVVNRDTAAGTFTLPYASGVGGTLVQLSSDKPQICSMPASVSVPAGARSATFAVSAADVDSPTAVTISAAYGGRSIQGGIQVLPFPVRISSLHLSPSDVYADAPDATATITLSGPAPASGARVLVAITPDIRGAVTPAYVDVAPGASSATFIVSGRSDPQESCFSPGDCPTTIAVAATLSATATDNVVYHTERGDGTLSLDVPGKKKGSFR
jgi:hypothetical protein